MRLVDRVYPDEGLDAVVQGIARSLIRIDPKLLSSLKSSVIRGFDLPIQKGILYEKRNAYHSKSNLS